jgi:hypothetical protein
MAAVDVVLGGTVQLVGDIELRLLSRPGGTLEQGFEASETPHLWADRCSGRCGGSRLPHEGWTAAGPHRRGS